ncbi:hypothetical protein BSKO_04122 [Bryopsis sp. KO-2023]|nr:hypothetical protein BSKO_04122 [Bryopsis sp. KO-2023]
MPALTLPARGNHAGFPRFSPRKAAVPKKTPLFGCRRNKLRVARETIEIESRSSNGKMVSLEDPETEVSAETVMDKEEHVTLEQEQQTKRLWKAAIKLPMYWVAVIPVMVGASLAFFEYGRVPFLQTTSLVTAAVLIILWLNLSNDAFDAKTGADEAKPESVVNLTGNRSVVLAGSIVALIAGIGLLATSLGTPNFSTSLGLLAFSIACGYVYQGPPFRWSYKGLGEPLCFFAFGPSAVTAFFLALSPAAVNLAHVPMSVWISSTLVGITTTLVLFCSHFHQHDGDKAVGKLSPIVRLGGTSPAVEILRWSCKTPFVLLVPTVSAQWLPWTVLVCCGVLAFRSANDLVAFAVKNHQDLGVIARLKVVALNLHSSFGLALCLGLVLARTAGL